MNIHDGGGRVLTGTDGNGKLYFMDAQDLAGRIVTRDDDVSGNGLTNAIITPSAIHF